MTKSKGKNPLKAVFFDIDDTLYPSTRLTEEARRNSLERMIALGLKADFDMLQRELNEIISEFSSNFEHHFDKLLQRLPRSSYKNINPAILVAGGVTAYHDTKIKTLYPFEDVKEVLKRLAKTDLVVGVISAGIAVKQAEKLVRMDVVKYLTPHAVFITDQVGFSKPNPRLYLRVCTDLNLSPTVCMYVGDNPVNDIDPPNQIGMITVLNKRSGKYGSLKGKTKPDYKIDNFWDLLDILRDKFDIELPE